MEVINLEGHNSSNYLENNSTLKYNTQNSIKRKNNSNNDD